MENWSTENLKEYFEKILAEKEKAYNQRFDSQEKAIQTAEHARDVAIKKAEDSIEKKSDAVYVKFTGLQETLTKVMFRPETESMLKSISTEIDTKFNSLSEKIDESKKEIASLRESRSSGAGKDEAQVSGRQRSQWTIGIIVTVIFSSLAFLFTVVNFVSRLTGK